MRPLSTRLRILWLLVVLSVFLIIARSHLQIPRSCPEYAIPYQAQTVFDIGMNTAQDTAQYLKEGWKVVGVEANPILAAEVSRRFSFEIGKSFLQVVVAGIHDKPGQTIPFYKHRHNTWSSFEKKWGCRDLNDQSRINMSLCETLQVNTVSCAELFLRFGVPHYLKVDIESFDWQCIKDLAMLDVFNVFPEFISTEDYNRDTITFLGKRGYKWFKVVEQQPFLGASGPFGHKAIDIYSGQRWRNLEEVLDPVTPFRPTTTGWRNLHAWRG